jgi:RNA polymerase sigma factor (sigma-70 family)
LLPCTIWDDDQWSTQLSDPDLRRQLAKVCLRYLKNTDAAEDVTQQVLARAWLRRHTFRGGSTLSWWLYRMARNACFNRLRDGRREINVEDATNQDPSECLLSSDRPEDEAQTRILAEQAQAAIAERARIRKPPWDHLDWLIFGAYFEQERTWPEVASLVGRAVEMVKYRYHQRIRPVLEEVGRHFQDEDTK